MLDLTELVEKCQECLDDLWRQGQHTAYPEARMQRLLEVVDSALCRAAQAKLGELDLWGASHTEHFVVFQQAG